MAKADSVRRLKKQRKLAIGSRIIPNQGFDAFLDLYLDAPNFAQIPREVSASAVHFSRLHLWRQSFAVRKVTADLRNFYAFLCIVPTPDAIAGRFRFTPRNQSTMMFSFDLNA
ncbi:hypothetical protein [Polaromonas sp. OV174]|uniref:hypothetical protein n=1 Tax=Polaromonas sp. OV174 TaxID=1855300 RepID=UPI00116012F9|nr:hypothetical protein [Polaromonas sp. OV174]